MNDAQELKSLLDSADQRNQEQEHVRVHFLSPSSIISSLLQKISQLENQIQRYITQINTLEDRLSVSVDCSMIYLIDFLCRLVQMIINLSVEI